MKEAAVDTKVSYGNGAVADFDKLVNRKGEVFTLPFKDTDDYTQTPKVSFEVAINNDGGVYAAQFYVLMQGDCILEGEYWVSSPARRAVISRYVRYPWGDPERSSDRFRWMGVLGAERAKGFSFTFRAAPRRECHMAGFSMCLSTRGELEQRILNNRLQVHEGKLIEGR